MTTTRDIGGNGDRVGQIDMRLEMANRSSGPDERWSGRVDALAAWLLAEWQREQQLRREAC
jgi:hypothetical protein